MTTSSPEALSNLTTDVSMTTHAGATTKDTTTQVPVTTATPVTNLEVILLMDGDCQVVMATNESEKRFKKELQVSLQIRFLYLIDMFQ